MDIFAIFAEQPLILVLILPFVAITPARPAWVLGWLFVLTATHRALYAMEVLDPGVKVILDDGAAIALFAGAVLSAVRRRRLVFTEAGLPLLVLLGVIASSAAANQLGLRTLVYGLRFSFLYTLLFLGIRNARLVGGEIRTLVRGAVVVGTVSACVGVGQFFDIMPHWSLSATDEQLQRGSVFRATGFLGGAGDLACYLVATMCLAWTMAVCGEGARRARLLWMGAAVVMAAALVCTMSRGPIVAAITAGLVILGVARQRSRVVVVCILLIAIAVAIVPGLWDRFTFLPYEYEYGETARGMLFFSALNLWMRHPWLGVGMGAYGGGAGVHVSGGAAYQLGVYSQIDNYLMGLLVQVGLIGLAAFLWLLVRIARRQLRIAQQHGGLPRALAVASLATMAATVPLSLAGTSLEQHGFAMFFWSMPALAAVAAQQQAARAAAMALVEEERSGDLAPSLEAATAPRPRG
jgi:O-antigen ligase